MTQNIDIKWQNPEKTPPYEGQFFVAVKYTNGLGTYDQPFQGGIVTA